MRKLLLLIGLISFSFANKDSNLTIFNNYKEAVEIAKEQKKPLFILFTKENCRWCKKLKLDLIEKNDLKDRLQEEFIVLYLDKNRDEFPPKYKIEGVPSVFLVSENEDIYTQIIGYHKDSKDYTKWFKYVKIEREE